MQTWGVAEFKKTAHLDYRPTYVKKMDLTFVSGATGTPIGNMTLLGGLAASFDGTNSKTFSACSAAVAASTGSVGKNWGAGTSKVIGQITVYSPSDRNYDGGTGSDPTSFVLQGSSDNSTWTTLGTIGSTNYSPNAAVTLASSQITQTVPYQYHQVLINAGGFQAFCSQLQFYDLQ